MSEDGIDKKGVTNLALERLRRRHDAERAALSKQQEEFIMPFQAISEMTVAFHEAIEQLDKHLTLSLRLAIQDPERANITRTLGSEIVNAITSAQELLKDRHAEGGAEGRALLFQGYLEVIAIRLVSIFHGQREQGGQVREKDAVAYLNQHSAAIRAPEELKKTLEVALGHLNTLDHFTARLKEIHEKISETIFGGLGDMMFDQTDFKEEDVRLMATIGDKIRNAALALEDTSGSMSLDDSLRQFEELLKDAKEGYLHLFKKYKTS